MPVSPWWIQGHLQSAVIVPLTSSPPALGPTAVGGLLLELGTYSVAGAVPSALATLPPNTHVQLTFLPSSRVCSTLTLTMKPAVLP